MKKLMVILSMILIIIACTKDEETTKYSLQTAVVPSNGGTVTPGTGEYTDENIIEIKATPNTGFVFHSWSGSINGTSATANVEMNSDKKVTANFYHTKYDLNLNVLGEGEVSSELIVPGDFSAETIVELRAIPSENWKFVEWSGDISNTENPIEVNFDTPKNITAKFEIKKYLLTINVEGEGEVLEEIVDAGKTTDYDSGTTVELTAVPEEGWEFNGWTGSLTSSENPISITVTEPESLIATFSVSEITQKGFDQPLKSYANIAVIPIDFTDTAPEDKALFPTKEEIKTLLESDDIEDFFDDASYGMFSYQVTVFDYVNLPFGGVTNGVLYNTSILDTAMEVDGLNPNEYDYLLFVPVHDWGLSTGAMNK